MRLSILDARLPRRLLLAAAGVLLASCSDQQPTAPAARRDGEAAEQWRPAGTFSLPATGGDGGFPLASTGIQIADGERARISVGGGITLAYNEEYSDACGINSDPPVPAIDRPGFCGSGAPWDGRTAGPLGFSALDDAMWVQVWMQRPDGQISRVGYWYEGAPLRPEITGPGTIYVSRTGFTGYFQFRGVYVWNASGTNTVTVEMLVPDSTHCETVLARSASAARLDVSGGCSPTQPQDPPKLLLVCNDHTDALQITRGDGVSCTAKSDVPGLEVSVRAWDFSGRPRADGDRLSTTWVGPMVSAGTVTVHGTIGGGAEQVAAVRISVQPRNWHWDRSKWSFRAGQAVLLSSTDDPRIGEPTDGVPLLMGWNCNDPTCRARWVEPDVKTDPYGGYTLEEVETGPNATSWYVKSAEFSIHRASNLSPYILPSAPTRTIHGPQANECHRNGMPGHGPVDVNFYTFNKVCKGIDMDDLLAKAWLHEGYGTTGHNGHQSVGEDVAGSPGQDPHALIEPVVGPSQQDARNAVVRLLERVEKTIDERAGDHRVVKGNYSGRVWMWNSTANAYVLITPNLQF